MIVVDDGSTDRTAELAAAYARVVKAPRNLGEGGARNLGAREAEGEILAFTDADVVVPEDWLEKIVATMDKEGVECVGGGYCGSMGDGFIERFAFHELAYRRKDLAGEVNTIVSNNFACRRDVFWEFGGFPERYKVEDLRLSYLISRKYRILWDRTNGVYHHFRPDLYGYLRQMYYFSRDTVWTYYSYPELVFHRTHQGRLIYVEIMSVLAALAAAPLWPAALLFAPMAVGALNYGFLSHLARNRLSVARSMGVIIARDLVVSLGIVTGAALCAGDAWSRRFGSARGCAEAGSDTDEERKDFVK